MGLLRSGNGGSGHQEASDTSGAHGNIRGGVLGTGGLTAADIRNTLEENPALMIMLHGIGLG